MKEQIVKTSIVSIAILILGASVIPGDTIADSYERESEPSDNSFDDELDQFMTDYEGAMPVGSFQMEPGEDINISLAQSFIPTKGVLTRVQFYMGRNATASYPCVVAIRDDLMGENLALASVDPDEFPVYEDLSWIEFDFDDILVTVGQTYYMVIYTANVTENYYWCGGNGTNVYPNGSAFISGDDGKTWEEFPEADGCFKTYGTDATELEIEITGGIGVTATIKNVGDVPAYDVEYAITVTGGILGLINVSVDGSLDELEPDEALVEKIMPIGFGPIEITVTADASNAEGVSEKANGFILLFFVILS